ncbi:MAG: MBL fold metallo-hydrolase [Vulcanimicrobiaceae bacterium]
MNVRKFTADGVSDRSYIVTNEANRTAFVVDAQRDVWTYLDAADEAGVKITHAFDTHVHNDFVSGSQALSERTGAVVVAAAGAGITYPVREVRDGEGIELAPGVVVRALHTPGHTFHHMSFALEEERRTVALFTGGSLLVETIGRTDLVSPGATERLARAQRTSLLRLFSFADDTEVFPTHGAGSFCSAGDAPDRDTTSIGREKRANRAARVALSDDEDAFVRFALHGLTAYPAYYAHMAPLNIAGTPALWRLPELEALDPRKALELQLAGGAVVDARPSTDFVRRFPRGARSIPLGDSFAGYIGMVLPFDDRLILVLPQDDDWRRAQTQLLRIGFDSASGYVRGGFAAWERDGLPVDRLHAITLEDLHALHKDDRAAILDVRYDPEWRAGHVAGATHIPIGSLPARLGDVPSADGKQLVTMCAGGTRATLAGSLLKRVGFDPFVVAAGGFAEWNEHRWPSGSEP